MTVLFGNRDTYGGRITAAIASIPGVVRDYAVTARWQQTCTGAGSGRPFAQSEHAESLSGGRCRARADEQRSGAGNGGGSHADIHRDLRPMRHVYSIAGIQLQSSRGNGKVDVAPVVDQVGGVHRAETGGEVVSGSGVVSGEDSVRIARRG